MALTDAWLGQTVLSFLPGQEIAEGNGLNDRLFLARQTGHAVDNDVDDNRAVGDVLEGAFHGGVEPGRVLHF